MIEHVPWWSPLVGYALGWLVGRFDRKTQDDPSRRFNHENRRGLVGPPPPLKFRRIYYDMPSTIAECGGPCTSGGPEACDCGALWRDVPIKPQPPPGRVVDVYGRTIGYHPRPQGGTPNPPPTDP